MRAKTLLLILKMQIYQSYISASRYMRSGPQMFRMAKQYESDGDIFKAYALYIKFTKFAFRFFGLIFILLLL